MLVAGMILLDVRRVLSIDELSAVGRIQSNSDRAVDKNFSLEVH
jgi:hypothetical protein